MVEHARRRDVQYQRFTAACAVWQPPVRCIHALAGSAAREYLSEWRSRISITASCSDGRSIGRSGQSHGRGLFVKPARYAICNLATSIFLRSLT